MAAARQPTIDTNEKPASAFRSLVNSFRHLLSPSSSASAHQQEESKTDLEHEEFDSENEETYSKENPKFYLIENPKFYVILLSAVSHLLRADTPDGINFQSHKQEIMKYLMENKIEVNIDPHFPSPLKKMLEAYKKINANILKAIWMVSNLEMKILI